MADGNCKTAISSPEIAYFILLTAFGIPDAANSGDKKIFVLESPHLHEIMYKRILSGDSGRTFSEHLSDGETKTPFGLLDCAGWPSKPQSLKQIGVINACPFPLQRDTYGPAAKHASWLDRSVRALSRIRNKPEAKKRRDQWDNAIETLIVHGLATRIASLLVHEVEFVPCGKVAKHLLEKAERIVQDPRCKIGEEWPHPSRNTWQNASSTAAD